MIYKMIPKRNAEEEQVYARIDDDGLCRVTCSEENPEFMAWVAEGNQPLPADE